MRKSIFNLSEVFLTHNEGHKKPAFTLAEVLITLGIIGIVAALNMPMLISNYQKEVAVTQLKKSYSLWSQAFQKILADEGVERLSDTQLWSYIEGTCDNNLNSGDTCGHTKFIPELKKYIKFEAGMGKLEYGSYKDTKTYLIKTNDGTILRSFYFSKSATHQDTETCNKIKELGGNICSKVGGFLVDINGDKKPNEDGKDLFEFFISDEGKLYPRGGKDNALYNNQTGLESNNYYWMSSRCGSYCTTGRIMENGWKIDSLYSSKEYGFKY